MVDDIQNTHVRDLEVLVIPHDGCRPEIWQVTSYTSTQDGVIVEEVDLRPFFPNGAISTLFCTIPSSDRPLPFAYRVYIDNLTTARPMNQTIHTIFEMPWAGNIVIVRYARGNTATRRYLANIQQPEAELVTALLGE